MNKALFFLFCTVFIFIAHSNATAQKKTIILVRHAEKAEAENAQNPDPELSAAGQERAKRLVEKIGKFRPGAFYSTDLKRTRETVTPLAAKRKKAVQIYDARKPQELVDAIMKSKTKRIVVAGHSNTIPGLANLLGKKELFKNLNDSEYGAIWIIRIKNGQIRKTEILPY